jgi:hypothetical protein
VVRNGYHQSREVLTSAGAVEAACVCCSQAAWVPGRTCPQNHGPHAAATAAPTHSPAAPTSPPTSAARRH